MNKNNLAKEMFLEMEAKMNAYREEIAEKYGNDAEALKEALLASVYDEEYYKNAYNNALVRGNRIGEAHAALVKENKELDAENFRLQQFKQKAIYVIEENKRLREALKLIQNSDTWLIEPGPMMHTIEEAYRACVGIADKALGDGDE